MRECSAYGELFVLDVDESGFCGRSLSIRRNKKCFLTPNLLRNEEHENSLHLLISMHVMDHFRCDARLTVPTCDVKYF